MPRNESSTANNLCRMNGIERRKPRPGFFTGNVQRKRDTNSCRPIRCSGSVFFFQLKFERRSNQRVFPTYHTQKRHPPKKSWIPMWFLLLAGFFRPPCPKRKYFKRNFKQQTYQNKKIFSKKNETAEYHNVLYTSQIGEFTGFASPPMFFNIDFQRTL